MSLSIQSSCENLVLLYQILLAVTWSLVGFSSVEAGSVRLKNTGSIMVKNILDNYYCIIDFGIFVYEFRFGYGSLAVGSKVAKKTFSGCEVVIPPS
ncbi:hypothetical protein MPTK1_2g11460 [Marchantia polymorpha subsp. ruderalis]|uniref:Uncharacterized protein n=1 Tax=Marchantia polymorpha TaxID=3197 RepID=A0A2R6XCG9_MARPO|nr:hypothetical protein MARPO_0023s0112 [Marchantia polymorpha]BBN01943.1 hypothetical protein Mp_2g11460 [Marchantia polymorpha subsp. ruderalis]|eukprot:PTQ43805.1 hypothetical protein MARPO_0023s0112 [Marchantia polymorpha]